jgi:membrane fusion protein, heavy metal efflux system
MSENLKKQAKQKQLIIIGSLLAVCLLSLLWLWSSRRADSRSEKIKVGVQHEDEHKEGEGKEVELSPEALQAAGIEVVEVTYQSLSPLLRFTGTVEANQQLTQQITPLVGGRVERVNVALGDRVRAGQILAIISSPEIAEMHGKLHEAETRLELAEKNYARVQRAENRAGLIQAKAKLDEAEATLRRTKKLIEIGAGAGKDLIAAEATYQTAKAEYDYQNNISINREVQEAKAEVETARVEVLHLRNSLRAFGASVPLDENTKVAHNTSTITLPAPISGSVTERRVNAGAGVQAGNHLLTISNLSTVWVIANVPEAQVNRLRVGNRATIRPAAVTEAVIGQVTYIDPLLNEETRTARVRVEATNPSELLKVGTFVEVSFDAMSATLATPEELAIPEEAIQRLGDRVVVFVPKEGEEGHFEVKDVELGGTVNGYARIISGLAVGEKVVTKGSFTLKTQLMKGEMGEHDH